LSERQFSSLFPEKFGELHSELVPAQTENALVALPHMGYFSGQSDGRRDVGMAKDIQRDEDRHSCNHSFRFALLFWCDLAVPEDRSESYRSAESELFRFAAATSKGASED
jgi:hypothetical protein